MEYDKLNAGENVPNPKTLGAFLGHFLGVSGPGSTTIVLLIKFCNFHEKFGQDPAWPREHCPRSGITTWDPRASSCNSIYISSTSTSTFTSSCCHIHMEKISFNFIEGQDMIFHTSENIPQKIFMISHNPTFWNFKFQIQHSTIRNALWSNLRFLSHTMHYGSIWDFCLTSGNRQTN